MTVMCWCSPSGTMTGGGGRVMKGRMGSSVSAEVTQEQVRADNSMEQFFAKA